jgi:ankyrin repeat protein
MRRNFAGMIFSILMCSGAVSAQVANKIDFRTDVQPIFKANCIGCHGPTTQKNGFRLDRRRDALRGGTIAVIGPGNSAGSRLYLRLLGTEFGLQMPLTGSLEPGKIEIIKQWIDQGAEWPDDASGEMPVAPSDPQATKIMEALRNSDRPAFSQRLRRYSAAVNHKGPNGATPLMYAALYGDAEAVRQLLKASADPNLKNNAGATALMWAGNDLEKTRLLVDAGANVNARSEDGQTPLLIAAAYFGASPVVRLLLDHGADPSVKVSSATGEMTPLGEASYAGDADVVQLLIERGADVKKAGFFAITFAALSLCDRCIDLLVQKAEPADLNMAMFFNAPPFNDPRAAKLLIDRGADIKATDPEGRTILMLAAGSATLPLETVKNLIERGADVNAKSVKGDTALALAKRHGQTPIVNLLIHAGAKEVNQPQAWLAKPAPARSIRAAVERSLPLLQRADVSFLHKSGCVSCHNNTLTAMTIASARENGFSVDERIARRQLKAISAYLDDWSERALQSIGIPGDSDTMSYILLGLAAENYPPDAATDALARFLKSKQTPDGRWLIFAHRPPIESSDFAVTAACLRALQVYAPKAQRAEYEKAIQLAARWLQTAQPKTTEDRAFQILGLIWAGKMTRGNLAVAKGSSLNHANVGGISGVMNANRSLIVSGSGDEPNRSSSSRAILLQSIRTVLSEQRPDGGWSQLPTLESDAYATGETLVALKRARMFLSTEPTARPVLSAIDAAYKRGTQFLLNSQLADGSWYVKSRALPIQPFFESGFPHGRDQFVSAAATNWATMALALASQP